MASVEEAQPETHATAPGPRSRSDLDLQAEVEEAIWRYEPLRVLHAPLRADVRNGEVTLMGVVPSRIIQYGLIEILERIPGIRAVHDRTLTDPDIDQAVTLALEQSPETKPYSIFVNVLTRNGFVQLTGVVPDEAATEPILRVVQSVPGVRRVANLLRTESPPP
jgi:osmotically-inducible protein OsmY